ncbi:MAG: hypothetical protein IAG13_34655 [Deltaproteobacteria bacterium]|nr:hypothetical protein [Nannocystaceae bacterium]
MIRAALLLPFAIGLGLGTWACRVPNRDHCANQDQPGNAFCAAKNPATPFCSPCTASYDGCVPFVPTACDEFATGPEESSEGSGGSSGSSSDS